MNKTSFSTKRQRPFNAEKARIGLQIVALFWWMLFPRVVDLFGVLFCLNKIIKLIFCLKLLKKRVQPAKKKCFDSSQTPFIKHFTVFNNHCCALFLLIPIYCIQVSSATALEIQWLSVNLIWACTKKQGQDMNNLIDREDKNRSNPPLKLL